MGKIRDTIAQLTPVRHPDGRELFPTSALDRAQIRSGAKVPSSVKRPTN